MVGMGISAGFVPLGGGSAAVAAFWAKMATDAPRRKMINIIIIIAITTIIITISIINSCQI